MWECFERSDCSYPSPQSYLSLNICGLLDIRSQKVETLVPLPIDLQEGKGAHISCLSLLGSLWEYPAWSCVKSQKNKPEANLRPKPPRTQTYEYLLASFLQLPVTAHAVTHSTVRFNSKPNPKPETQPKPTQPTSLSLNGPELKS